MNRLQKNAWIELGIMFAATAVGAICFAEMTTQGIHGISYIVAYAVCVCVLAPPIMYFTYKDELKYDERERSVRGRASTVATYIATLFILTATIVPYFLVGGRGSLPAYYLIIILWGYLLINQVCISLYILLHCAKEQADE